MWRQREGDFQYCFQYYKILALTDESGAYSSKCNSSCIHGSMYKPLALRLRRQSRRHRGRSEGCSPPQLTIWGISVVSYLTIKCNGGAVA